MHHDRTSRMLRCAVRNEDLSRPLRSLDQHTQGPGSALSWLADRVVDLLPDAEVALVERPPWGIDAGVEPDYPNWVRDQEARAVAAQGALPETGPLISVVVPVYRPPIWYFRGCIASVMSQRYRNWELCVCDDASGDSELLALIDEIASSDSRIKVARRETNGGISRATNDAIALATGEFVAFLDHDDLLHPHALSSIVSAIEPVPEADIVYTDEDTMQTELRAADVVVRRFRPYFKPGWAPDLLLTYPYLGHLLVVRRALVEQIGGLRPEFDGSQDYDLMLRAAERAREVVHVPKVLYHWRAVEGSAADDPTAKPWAHKASRRVLENALERRAIDAVVEDGPIQGWYHVRRRILGNPSIQIIIPFRDQASMTAKCVESLRESPGYENFEVTLVDNGSTEPETRALLSKLERDGLHVLEHPGPFNWAAINNHAASHSRSDLILFMNNDVEAGSDGWLSSLVEHAQRPEVGAVGARLVFPDGIVQHAGVVLGLGLIAGHLFAGMHPGAVGYLAWDRVVRPYSAVTAACMMSRRAAFESIGGFDENLEVAYNDVDYCMRLTDAGYTVLYTPHAQLIHDESASRGISGFVHDICYFLSKWDRGRLSDDPLYNPNLGLFGTWCRLRDPGEMRIWQKEVDSLMGV